MTRLRPEFVYRVSCSLEETVSLGLGVVVEADTTLSWFDTLRTRVRHGTVVRGTDEMLEFRDQRGRLYRFEPLTLEVYNREVRATVEGTPFFPTDRALHRFYSEKFA